MHIFGFLTKRCILAFGIFVAVTVSCTAQQTTVPALPAASRNAAAAAPTWVPLWPEGAPGALGTAPEDIPAIEVFLPRNNPMRSAIIICPGGSYMHLSLDREGEQEARWLNDRGIAGIVLRYRLGPRYHHPIEMGDAQRALRYVRSHADQFGIDKDKVGIWGFSAGGHLASTVGTHFDAGNPAAADPIDRESSRPDFMVLSYAVITMQPPYVHMVSRQNLLGDNPDPALVTLLSNDQQVTHDTPPTFLFQTTDDRTVPVQNAIMFYQALITNGVSAELHIYQHGPHGSSLGQNFPELRGWPNQLMHWLVANGWAQGT
jgi:acetyl esterase/lipase